MKSRDSIPLVVYQSGRLSFWFFRTAHVLVVSALVLCAGQSADAQDYIVQANGAGGAYTTVQAAIDAAVDAGPEGKIIELRADVPGTAQELAQSIDLSAVNISSTNEDDWLTIRVREGDTIIFSTTGTLLNASGTSRGWKVEGNSSGYESLQFGDRSEFRHTGYLSYKDCYTHNKGAEIASSCSNYAIRRALFTGASGDGSYEANHFYGSDFELDTVAAVDHGTNAYDYHPDDPATLRDWGDTARVNGVRVRMLNLSNEHGGHNSWVLQCVSSVVRNSDFTGYWDDISPFPGARAMVTQSVAGPAPYGPLLLENSIFRDSADSVDQKNQCLIKSESNHLIMRDNFFFDSDSNIWHAAFVDVIAEAGVGHFSHQALYHNTAYVTKGIWWNGWTEYNPINGDAQFEENLIANNLFQEVSDNTKNPGQIIRYDTATVGLNGWANGFHGTVIKGNIFAGPSPNMLVELRDPTGVTKFTVFTPPTGLQGNVFANVESAVTFADVGSPRNRTKAGFEVTDWGPGASAGDAPALTTINANSDGTTISVDNARPFFDGWGIRGEAGDYLYIGATAAAAELDGPVQIESIDYTNNTITLTPATARPASLGQGVWFGGNPASGSPAIRKNRGAFVSLAPAVPTGLTATAVSPSQIDLVWTDNAADETAFRIQRKDGAGGDYGDTNPAVVGANTEMFSDTVGVAGGTTYHYQVRSESASGYSAWSAPAAATTPEADVTPPDFTALTASPEFLWPPNHQMMAVNLDVTATDDRDPAPVTKILSVTSSEADTGEPDWVIIGDLRVDLRAERNGDGTGRLYTITVQSTDASGNSSTAAIIISVGHGNDTKAPTVALTAPVAGAVLKGTIPIAATASDNHSVVGVRFRLDGANVGLEDSSAPYGFGWDTTTATNGSHTLTAVARDQNGNTRTSAPVTVVVDNAPPSVTITAPANGALLSGQGIPIAATASDNVAVAGVLFRLDGVALTAEDKTAPYGFRWTSLRATDGGHVLTAEARDTAGNTAASAPITLIVDNLPPVVALMAPTVDSVVGGASVPLIATATDIVGVAGVQFRVDGNDIGSEDTTAPYTVAWDATGLSEGTHVLTAVARDLMGRTAVSAAVAVTVDNTAPVIAITAPAAGSTLEGTVVVGAEANDAAPIAGVQFRLNGVDLGAEDTAAPFSIEWMTTTTGNGNHVLTATARDVAGNIATSAPVTVTVANAAPLMFEAESLTFVTLRSVAPTDAAGASNGRYMLINISNAGEDVTYTINVPADGTYLVATGLATQGNRGIFRLLVDEVDQGDPQDYYTPGAVALFSERDLGTRFLAAGAHSFRFLCTGRHPSASNRKHALDYIKLTPQ